MQYRKSSLDDLRLREERERLECTFSPKLSTNPFVSEKTLRKYGQQGSSVRPSARRYTPGKSRSPNDKSGANNGNRINQGLLAGMYTAADGLKRGPPDRTGIPMFYFDPFSPPNFTAGTYGAPQTVTQVIQVVAPTPPPAAPAPPVAPPPAPAKSELKAPPLPPWAGGSAPKAAAPTTASNKIVIVKKDRSAEPVAEVSGWNAVLQEMQRRANKRAGGTGEAEKAPVKEAPKPQPKKKQSSRGKPKTFKDPVEELKYKFALKRGEIKEEEGDDDDGEEEEVAEEKATPAPKKDIASMLAAKFKAAAPATLAPPKPETAGTNPASSAASATSSTAGSGAGGDAAKLPQGKVPSPPPLPTAWPPVPSTVKITAPAASATSSSSSASAAATSADSGTSAPPKKLGGALAGAAAALQAALAARNGGGAAASPAPAPAPSSTPPPAPAASSSVPAGAATFAPQTAPVSGATVTTILKEGETPPAGAETRVVTLPGSKKLPDGYYLAATTVDMVAPHEILAAGETSANLILQMSEQFYNTSGNNTCASPGNTSNGLLSPAPGLRSVHLPRGERERKQRHSHQQQTPGSRSAYDRYDSDDDADDDSVLIDQLASTPAHADWQRLGQKLSTSDLPVPAGYVATIERMQRSAQKRAEERLRLEKLELRNYDPLDSAADNNSKAISSNSIHSSVINKKNDRLLASVDLSAFLTAHNTLHHTSASSSSVKGLSSGPNSSNNLLSLLHGNSSQSKSVSEVAAHRLYATHTASFQQKAAHSHGYHHHSTAPTATTLHRSHSHSASKAMPTTAETYTGHDIGGQRWFQSLRSRPPPPPPPRDTGLSSDGNQTVGSSSFLRQTSLAFQAAHLPGTQPVPFTFLSDDGVQRRQQLREQRLELEQEEQRLQELEQKAQQARYYETMRRSAQRSETTALPPPQSTKALSTLKKIKQYQKLLSEHNNRLLPEVRQDITQKLQALTTLYTSLTGQDPSASGYGLSSGPISRSKPRVSSGDSVVSHGSRSRRSRDASPSLTPVRRRLSREDSASLQQQEQYQTSVDWLSQPNALYGHDAHQYHSYGGVDAHMYYNQIGGTHHSPYGNTAQVDRMRLDELVYLDQYD